MAGLEAVLYSIEVAVRVIITLESGRHLPHKGQPSLGRLSSTAPPSAPLHHTPALVTNTAVACSNIW